MSVKKKGIDISVWQGNINAGRVKNSGIEFVILREGYRQAVDSRFFENASSIAITVIPARFPARIPAGISSNTRQREGSV